MISTTLHHQFLLAQARHPGKVALLREAGGEFYCAFDHLEALERASGLQAKDGYLRLPLSLLASTLAHLMRAGEFVALCDQVEEPL